MDLRILVGLLVALVALWALLLAIFWAVRPKTIAVREVVRLIPDVLRLLRSIIGDGSAPLGVRLVLVGLVAWILSPIDLIPEFIPILGPIDDVVVAVIALRYARKRFGVENLRGRWSGSSDGFEILLRLIGSG